jgi:hypothetical protein
MTAAQAQFDSCRLNTPIVGLPQRTATPIRLPSSITSRNFLGESTVFVEKIMFELERKLFMSDMGVSFTITTICQFPRLMARP